MARRYRMIMAAALLAGGSAFAQSPTMTAPNNAVGSPMDTPPKATRPAPMPDGTMPTDTESAITAFDKLDRGHDGYMSRTEVSRLPGNNIDFDEADLNRDGRLDRNEFERFWNDYQGAGR